MLTRQMLPYPTSPLVSLFTFYLHNEHIICINDWFRFQCLPFNHLPELICKLTFFAARFITDAAIATWVYQDLLF